MGGGHTIVYDWNGTLINDVDAVLHCVCLTLNRIGCADVTLEYLRENYDMPLENFYRGMGVPEKDLSKIYNVFAEVFHDNYEPLVEKAELRQGGTELLAYVHGRNVRQVVLSNHLAEPIRHQMGRLCISNFITEVLANDDRKTQFTGKPKGEKLRLYVEEHKLRPEQIIIVGDSPEEMVIARQLGLASIAITEGLVSEKRLVEARPDYLVHSLIDVVPVLEARGFGG